MYCSSAKAAKELEGLKQRLLEVRTVSLDAVRRNDYVAVAKLTKEAAKINKAIADLSLTL